MATVTITIALDDQTILSQTVTTPSDADVQTAIKCFSVIKNYQPIQADGTPNDESPADFMVRHMRESARNVILNAQADQAAEAARQAVLNKPIAF